MAPMYKIAVVVKPLPASPTDTSPPQEKRFLQFAAPDTNLAQLWRQIEAFYKTNYLAQSLYSSFAIKKLQDEDGNDLDIFFKLSDIFADVPKKVLHVIQTRVDRDVSIPITSHLRPAEAFKRPLLPPINDQSYVNLDPDRPVSSTERDVEDDEVEDARGDERRVSNDIRSIREEVDEDLMPQERRHSARDSEIRNGKEDRGTEITIHDRAHEADDEDDINRQERRRNSTRQLPQDDILAASDRALASLSTQNQSSTSVFAKPALPVLRAQSQRPGQLRSTGRLPSDLFSRSVSNPYVRASVFVKSPESIGLRYNVNNPFEIPESEGPSPEGLRQTRSQGDESKLIDSASRSAAVSRESANTHTRTSSHPVATISPPTSNESLPHIGSRRIGSKVSDLVPENANAPSARHSNGYLVESSQGRGVTPVTANKNLTRVQSRPTSTTTSRVENLGVPEPNGTSKLLSPFQPVPPTGIADAPSFTTDDAAGSQASSTGKTAFKVGNGTSQPPPSNDHAIGNGVLDAHIDDVEDSMHEDVLDRAAARRKGARASKQFNAKPSEPKVVPRSSSSNQTQQTPIESARTGAIATLVNKTKTPTSAARPEVQSTTAMPIQHPLTAPQTAVRSTPASSAKEGSGTQKRSSAKASGSKSLHRACESCRRGKRRCIHNADGSIDPSRLSASQGPPKAMKLTATQLQWVQSLSSQAAQEAVDAEPSSSVPRPAADVQMEDVADHDSNMTEELQDSLRVPPPPEPDHMEEMEVELPTKADEALQEQVRDIRNSKTLTWLRDQQEEAQRSQASAQSAKQMQHRRMKSREKQASNHTELTHKKPDRKGKGRAVHTKEDVALLKSAGLAVSDELVDDLEDSSEGGSETGLYDEMEAGPSHAITSKSPAKDVTNKTSPRRQELSRDSPPFAVVIQIPPGEVNTKPPQPRSQASDLPESTPLDSQGLPTSAQPVRKATRRSSAISPTTVARADTTSANNDTRVIPQKLRPSQEYFAFLPDKPAPESAKRKRKAPGSSPPENLASEFRRVPEKKKRRVESASRPSKTTIQAPVAVKGGSPKEPIDVQSDSDHATPLRRSASRSRRASNAAPGQKSPLIMLDHGNESPSRTRRATTVAPSAKQQPIVIEPDIEPAQKNAKSPSRSRRATTAAPTNRKASTATKSLSPIRRRTSRTASTTMVLDGAADPPDQPRKERSKGKEDVTPRRPSAPQRSSAQLISQIPKPSPGLSTEESATTNDSVDDVSMVDDEIEAIHPRDETPSKEAIDSDSKPAGQNENKSKAGKSSATGSEELEFNLQSSAQQRFDSEERRKSEMDEAIANYAPPLSFPIASSQPSPPHELVQASQTESTQKSIAPVQISQTSTTRSPQSSPLRSQESRPAPAEPSWRQRSSSPYWVKPRWMYEKEDQEANRSQAELRKSRGIDADELHMSARKSLAAARSSSGQTPTKNDAPSAQSPAEPAVSKTTQTSSPLSSTKRATATKDNDTSSEESSDDASESESDSEVAADDKKATPKANQSMLPPPLPTQATASTVSSSNTRETPATPLKSILKKSSSSLSSTSQRMKQVSMDAPEKSVEPKASTAFQSMSEINGEQAKDRALSRPQTKPSASQPAPARSSVAAGKVPASQPVVTSRSPFVDDEASSNDDDEDESSTDGDVEDNEVEAPVVTNKAAAQSTKTAASPITVSAAKLIQRAASASGSDIDTSSDDSDSPSPKHPSRANLTGNISASQPAPTTKSVIISKTATRTTASSPITKPKALAAKPQSDSDDTTSSDESGESGYSRDSDVPEDVEREVARQLNANPRAKLGVVRQLVKFDQRMARRTQRENDKSNAAMKKRTQDLKDMLRNSSLEDPDRKRNNLGGAVQRV